MTNTVSLLTKKIFRAGNRKQYLRWLRIAFTLGIFAFVFTRINPLEVIHAMKHLPPLSFLKGLGVFFFAVAFSVMRWRSLLMAYGAQYVPRALRLAHLYMVGYFYNTYAPGAIGGDVVRGIAVRKAFGDTDWKSGTSSLTVVFVDRAINIIILLLIGSVTYWTSPLIHIPNLRFWSILGLTVLFAVILGITLAARLAPLAPPKIAHFLRSLPQIHSPTYFLLAFVSGFLVQASNIMAGHLIMKSLDPSISLIHSVIAISLISVSAYFPLTVGGSGVREGMFLIMYGAAGVAKPTAYAGALIYWSFDLIFGVFGGIINLCFPLSKTEKTVVQKHSQSFQIENENP